jgi:crossover junction endodeoxyribonuclease RuvC
MTSRRFTATLISAKKYWQRSETVLTTTQRILGIDPGSRLTGFGVIDFDGDKAAYVASGTVKSIDGAFADRLRQIFESVGGIVDEFRPDIVAVESVFMHKNAGSALKLGHARSAAICATFAHGVEIFEYAPREIKQAVVGTGAATKEQVQHMVVSILTLDGTPAEDAADALAAALCHGHQRRLQIQLGTGKAIAGAR